MTLQVDLDARCDCTRCENRTAESYAMLHYCLNCKSEFTARHRMGDRASARCPFCGAHWVRTTARGRIEESTDA